MKNKPKPTPSQWTIFRQICNHIPAHMVPQLARQTGVDEQARTFSPWSHVAALLHAQLSHSLSLNDVCDSLQYRASHFAAIRGAAAPSRNGFSHANRQRSPALAEKLFWAVLSHLKGCSPGFGKGSRRCPAFRFKSPIHVVDSTVIELVANCLDWAKHRRRKAAAKTHLRLNFQSLLPECVIVDTAAEHDNDRSRELCARLRSGEIVVFDRAYVDYGHLRLLDQWEISWVTRAKKNMAYNVVEQRAVKGSILRDEIIVLRHAALRPAPERMRRVEAKVEVDGKEQQMSFLTNNMEWKASSVADLYRCRWDIEVFFKQIKQSLQLADFLGHNANAVRWQIWTALLAYVLLRYLSYLSRWGHSFNRLMTALRAVLWEKYDLQKMLDRYGTAAGHFQLLARPEQAYLPGFLTVGQHPSPKRLPPSQSKTNP
jgi:hypothetical protein